VCEAAFHFPCFISWFCFIERIKNGARKIVLDQVEEASNAAFLAFNSLGFSVPQFAPHLLSTATHDYIRQGAGSTFGSDTTDTSRNFVDANHNDNSNKFTFDKEKEDLIKLSVNGARGRKIKQ